MKTIWTIGHSTHPIEEFISILKEEEIGQVADVRTVPRSRYVPQYNQDNLRAALQDEGIAYVHLKELGGLRHSTGPSPNTGWRNPRFRAYADYMQTVEFDRGFAHLEELASSKRTVVMCAEGLPWRCHRLLISDALMARGWRVEEIMPDGKRPRAARKPAAAMPRRSVRYDIVPAILSNCASARAP